MKTMKLPAASATDFAAKADGLSEKPISGLRLVQGIANAEPDRPSEIGEAHVRAIVRARRNRAHYFPHELFADPAWDILLELYAAELGQRRVTVTSLAHAAAVPPTTAARWINCLEDQLLIVRSPDALDARRWFVRLSAGARTSMAAYFASERRPSHI